MQHCLRGKNKIKFKQSTEGVYIYLEGVKLNDTDTIIELNIK